MLNNEHWNLYKSLKELKDYKYNKSSNSGYVYIVQYGKFIKIGKTIDPIVRINNINGIAINYAGEKVEKVLLSIPHVDYANTEKILHKHFSEYRIHKGELFNLTIEEVKNNSPELNLVRSDSHKKELDEGVRYRNSVLDNYYNNLPSNNFYDDCIENIKTIEESEYNILLLKFFENDGYIVKYKELDDKDFIKLVLMCNLIVKLINEDFSNNYINSEIQSSINDLEYIARGLSHKKELYQ